MLLPKIKEYTYSNIPNIDEKSDFFSHKRKIQSLSEEFIINWWFGNKTEMKEFLYNEKQDLSDWIIMEVNEINVWWPWMIEHVDLAYQEYIKKTPRNIYNDFLKKLDSLLIYENNLDYFEKYVLSTLKSRQAKELILLFGKTDWHNPSLKDIWLSEKYAKYLSLKDFINFIENNKKLLNDILLMPYGFSVNYKREKYHEKFKEKFWDRYINENDLFFSSKQRPYFTKSYDLTWPYLVDEDIRKIYWWNIVNDTDLCLCIQSSYVLKLPFMDQWKWIYFPGQWKFLEWNKVQTNNKKTTEYYALQKYHELPRKFSLENWEINVKSVDLRAYLTMNFEENLFQIQLFGREWNVGCVNNVSSGWKFSKVYVVEDDEYYDIQRELNNILFQMPVKISNSIESFFDEYFKRNFKLVDSSNLSTIPFIISASWFDRIQQIVSKLIENMVDSGVISKNNEWQIVWTTIIWIDMSINPLPKKDDINRLL